MFGDRLWRLENLYWIVNERGERVKFKMRDGQRRFVETMHNRNIILKARQLGFSTLIDIILLDACVFNSNQNAGIIAQTLPDAKEIFRTKVKYPYDNLPEGIKQRVYPTSDSKDTLALSNNSQLRVGTSMRSSTLNWLHITEHAKICARFPDRAKEIKTGALPTVHSDGAVFIESTAEGREGDFYSFCKEARDHADAGKALNDLTYKFHFHPWWKDPKYALDPHGIPIPRSQSEYFAELHARHGIQLTPEQMAWYVLTRRTQGEDMFKEFPSTPDEPFLVAIEGAYFATEMRAARLEGRIGPVKHNPNLPVYTFWDIGMNDKTCICFMQPHGPWHLFIDYYENAGEGLGHYAHVLQQKPYTYAAHYLPHDGKNRDRITAKPYYEHATQMLKGEVYVVPRALDKINAIQSARMVISSSYFDETNCEQLIKGLDHYRKEWNELTGTWRNKPLHDWASDRADSYMTFATGYQMPGGDDSEEDTRQTYYDNEHRSDISGY